MITKWLFVGAGEAVLGGASIFLGFSIPMSGLTLIGIG